MQNLKLISIGKQGERTKNKVGSVVIGEGFVVDGGPCGVESEEQTIRTAEAVKVGGGMIFRGGAFKPRTSPYDFQGLGLEGLKILAPARCCLVNLDGEKTVAKSFRMLQEKAEHYKAKL